VVTVLTRTIGPSGRDYASFTLAEADVENIGTSADLVANDEAIVFEADAAVYAHPTNFQSSLTTDATRNVTYRAATGSEHEGSSSSGVRLQNTSGNGPIFDDDHTAMEGIVFLPRTGTTTAYGPEIRNAEGNTFRNCISDWRGNQRDGFSIQNGSSSAPTVLENCVCLGDSTFTSRRSLTFNSGSYTSDLRAKIRNCTIINEAGLGTTLAGSGDITIEFINCLSIGPNAYYDYSSGTTAITGSNCFGDATDPWPASVQSTPATVTTSTAYDPGAGDFALYVGKNGALLDSPNNDVIDQGVGPSANSDVPTTDILGNARSGATANPGAFEQPQATATITKTIGPSGRDYTTFTLAEADVANIGGSADLVNENERIIFEADAGTYSASFTVSSTLTTDATRQVTYKAASGAEHSGSLSAGVILSAVSYVADSFTTLHGLVLSGSSHTAAPGTAGVTYRSCLGSNPISNTCFDTNGSGSAQYPTTYENCVGFGQSSAGAQRVWALATYSGDCYAKLVNCTCVADGRWAFFVGGSTANTFEVEIVNFLSLGESAVFVGDYTDPARTFTGSNNFGGSTTSFPAALQGSPYPITATIDAEGTLAAGDYAIHDSNGRLYNITTNDVWQAGIGPASDSDVPTTDILGATRSGTTANPGAFELGVGESNEPPALPGLTNATPDFRVHLDRRVTDATTGVSSTYDASANTTTFTLPYKLNTAATMQVVTRKTSSANAGQSLTVVSTDATNRRVVVSGNHTGTAVFIGEKYTMKYEFSELHLQRNKNTYAAEPITAASHRVRYGRVNYGQTSFFKVTVTPKGGASSTYVFNGNLLNEPETQLGSVALYDGHFQFPVLADHDRVTIELENDSPLPSRFLSCEWESFYHSRIGSRSRY